MDEQTNRWTDKWTSGQMDRKTDALIDRPMKDRPIDGWTNGQIDRLTD